MGDRSLLEPFKFLTTREVATVLPLVSRRWRSLSSQNELWTYLLYRDSGHDLGFYASPSRDQKLAYYFTLYHSSTQVPLLCRPCSEFAIANIDTGQREIVHAVIAEQRPSWCCLAMGGLLVCGGRVDGQCSRNSLMLVGSLHMSVKTGPLCEGRDGHSLCRVESRVYAFGGQSASEDLSTCERFSTTTQRWEPIASLPLSLSEVPAAYVRNVGVFLVHSKIPTKVLKFDTDTEAFSQVIIRFLSSLEPVTMFAYRQTLVIIGKEFSVMCDAGTMMQQHRFRTPSVAVTPRVSWLLSDSRALLPLSEGSVLKVDVLKRTAEVLPLRR